MVTVHILDFRKMRIIEITVAKRGISAFECTTLLSVLTQSSSAHGDSINPFRGLSHLLDLARRGFVENHTLLYEYAQRAQ